MPLLLRMARSRLRWRLRPLRALVRRSLEETEDGARRREDRLDVLALCLRNSHVESDDLSKASARGHVLRVQVGIVRVVEEDDLRILRSAFQD